MSMNIAKLELKGQTYRARLDFLSLGKAQANLKKQGFKYTFKEIFEAVQEQDFTVITEVVIESVLRIHPQIPRATLEDALDFDELENVFTFVADLIEKALPTQKK
jgi:hypothetical protein